MIDFESARARMVDNQLRTTDVTSHSLLSAFLTVPREAFVAEKLAALAYIDSDLEIAPATDGQAPRYMMEPSPLGKLLQAAEIGQDDVVLDVGAGTGYASAIMSRLAKSVLALNRTMRWCRVRPLFLPSRASTMCRSSRAAWKRAVPAKRRSTSFSSTAPWK